MYGDEWPLRVTGIASAAESEWRIGQQTPERTCEGWLLVYVKSGMVEELCDTHRVLLRAGQILFHQPAELFAMRAVGEVPPEVFRVEFTADGSAMDSFRSCHMRLGNAEKSCLRQLAETVREVFQPVQDACQMPARRAEIPVWRQRAANHLSGTAAVPVGPAAGNAPAKQRPPCARAEQEQAALVESVRLYFAQNIENAAGAGPGVRCQWLLPSGIAAGVPRPHPHGADGVFLLHESRTGSAAADPGVRPRRNGPYAGVWLPGVVQQAVPRPDRPNARRLPPRPAPAASVRTVKVQQSYISNMETSISIL